MTSTPTTTTTPSGSIDGVPAVILTALACSLITLVVFTAVLGERADRNATRAVESNSTSTSLPAKCRQFYNDGSGDWIVCIGVELK